VAPTRISEGKDKKTWVLQASVAIGRKKMPIMVTCKKLVIMGRRGELQRKGRSSRE